VWVRARVGAANSDGAAAHLEHRVAAVRAWARTFGILAVVAIRVAVRNRALRSLRPLGLAVRSAAHHPRRAGAQLVDLLAPAVARAVGLAGVAAARSWD